MPGKGGRMQQHAERAADAAKSLHHSVYYGVVLGGYV
jgi:hypothetical protein